MRPARWKRRVTKVLPLPSTPDGKITAEQVENAYLAHVNDASFEHMVQPKLVYISLPTENGGLYSKAGADRPARCLHALRAVPFLLTAHVSATA